jgi:flagellar hook-basal body complex protein FliE
MIAGLNILDRLNPSDFLSGAGGLPSAATPSMGAAETFGAAMRTAVTRTVDTLQSAEAISLKALVGEADTRQVADAVMSAEQSLQTAIAIRDKIVTAYLEVSRMQI